ncbi:MAG: 4-hydroxy-tetrahydrodipicolinate synthase [Sphingomonadaceae bacterium]|nr:4-hydroxy-tetrahydrodipicolinate synthase [Sphingomonadaceae bacterium]
MTQHPAFTGSLPALVTPFKGGRIDEDALRALVEWQIENGSSGLVPVGTTGESPTLSHDEHKRVVEIVIAQAKGRVPVIAGAGSNNTTEAIDLAVHAEKAGAQAALVVTPYYNRPSQEGLYQHYKALSEAAKLPIILYNVPARTSVDLSVETMARLAKLPNIAGVKDASGNVARVSAQRLACGPDFQQISGNDDMALGFMAHGGIGCISVTANVAPKLCAEFQDACLAGDWARARALQDRLYPLHAALFTDASPGPTKYALEKLGRMTGELRLPLVAAGATSRAAVDAALTHAGIG